MKVVFRHINMSFGDVEVLDDINLDVREGELICLLGPSGCGKSTLLNIVGGFITPSEGEVTIDGERVTGPDPRRIFVFQERGVFPWLTVEQNIGFGLFRQSEKRRPRGSPTTSPWSACAASKSRTPASSPAA
jgi:ABC-type nitrate/sulfonate/bicarbonate transport system ATPase subunit